jgi:hypothetical protein
MKRLSGVVNQTLPMGMVYECVRGCVGVRVVVGDMVDTP